MGAGTVSSVRATTFAEALAEAVEDLADKKEDLPIRLDHARTLG